MADTLANLDDVSMGGHIILAKSLDEQPEWKYLTQFFSCRGLELDVEIEKAATEITALV